MAARARRFMTRRRIIWHILTARWRKGRFLPEGTAGSPPAAGAKGK